MDRATDTNNVRSYTLGYACEDRKRAAYFLALFQNAAAKHLYERHRRDRNGGRDRDKAAVQAAE